LGTVIAITLAEIAIVAYGSVARSAVEAAKDARKQGLKVGVLQLIALFPLPRIVVEERARRSMTIIVPELNMGQISREVKRVNQGMSRVVNLNKLDGNLITPAEIPKKNTRGNLDGKDDTPYSSISKR